MLNDECRTANDGWGISLRGTPTSKTNTSSFNIPCGTFNLRAAFGPPRAGCTLCRAHASHHALSLAHRAPVPGAELASLGGVRRGQLVRADPRPRVLGHPQCRGAAGGPAPLHQPLTREPAPH